MKCTILSESPADEAAVRVLVDAVLRATTEPVDGPPLRSRGWPSVHNISPSVLKHLHYHTDAEGLVVVVDANGSPHRRAPDQRCTPTDPCRLCKLRTTLETAALQLRPVPGRVPIKFAVGLAVPAVEGWYRCGVDPRVTEAAWVRGLAGGKLPYDKRVLKREVYGTDRPGLQLETECAVREARRLAANLALLEQQFPAGFGSLASDLRRW